MTSAPAPRSRPKRGGTTRESLVALAVDIMRAEGLPAVTMTRVAEAAGVTTPALYRYFEGGRHELVVAIIRDAVDRFVGHVTSPDVRGHGLDEQLRVESERKLGMLHEIDRSDVRLLYATVLGAPGEADAAHELDDAWRSADGFIRGALDEAVSDGEVRADLRVDATVDLWVAIGVGIDIMHALGQTKVGIDDLYDEFRSAFLRHVAPDGTS